jgi:hypothetical protein
MSTVVLDIDDELIADLAAVLSIADELEFEHESMRREQEVHARARTRITWSELFRPNVGHPRAQQRVQQILYVVFGLEGQRNGTAPAVCQWMHRSR